MSGKLVTIRTARAHKDRKVSPWKKHRWWLIGGVLGLLLLSLGAIALANDEPVLAEAPEASKVLSAQEGLNFGILIPAYMPRGFDREAMDLKVSPSGPSGEPLVELTYRNLGKKAAIFLRQWVPGNAEMETLIGSVPIETRWGKGYLHLRATMASIWVDIGQLRIAISSPNLGLISEEQLLQMANTLGLASQEQAYSFKMEPITIKGIAPPPPFIVQMNAEGVQEFNLTITPGGYSPMRFQVKKGVPVKINFRAVGEVACGVTGAITQPGGNSIGIAVTKEKPLSVVEFTPEEAGDWPFYCSSNCYRGVMTVVE
ncbi:MAG: cupredoxin domain-containing protein [Dehalococcoidales bacterium]|nr:cupredoxin domain-containing protein [Dehalococcoidales bacterium]